MSNTTNPTPAQLLALARAALAEPGLLVPAIKGGINSAPWINYRNLVENPAVIAALCERLADCVETLNDHEIAIPDNILTRPLLPAQEEEA